ncbi:DUF4172 domain-containing protein [Novosphingobium acidiphilum]|uniref:DUF4172 domain-containing protein n=1 Tax=Novosphingobium acidiphilum TaxID=505248 RepID=UPI001FDEE428|nr:DUF4172 domain-containing protein [Novosphingobium acidiphilum]
MRRNWRQPDWPNFRWNSDARAALESSFLQQSGVVIGVAKHLGDDDRINIIPM